MIKKLLIILLYGYSLMANDNQIEDANSSQTKGIDCLFATQIDRLTTVISEPGAYCLTEDITVPLGRGVGFIIEVDNVLLDLNRHTLTGLSQTSIGILIRTSNNIAPRNIIIQNGTITLMRGAGISVINASAVTIDSVIFVANTHGLLVNILNNSTIRNCSFTLSTGNGIFFNPNPGSLSQSNTILNCISFNNGLNGYSINNCVNLIFQNNIANNNGTNGFLQTVSNQCSYEECFSNNNTTVGFAIAGNGNVIEQCESKGNGSHGFQIGGLSNCILNSLAKLNGGTGFLLTLGSAQSQVRNNTAVANAIGFQNNGAAVPAANANRFYANFANNNSALAANNFVNIANVATSPVPADPINFTTNISN